MRSIISILKEILSLLNVFKQFKNSVETGSSYIKILNIGICWGSFAQSYASTGQKNITVTYPFAFLETPIGLVTTQDAMRGYGTGTPNAYGIAPTTQNAIVSVWVNRAYASGTNDVYWLVIGKLGGVLTNLISHLQRRWAVC